MKNNTYHLSLPLFLLISNSYAAEFIKINDTNFLNYMQVSKNTHSLIADQNNAYSLVRTVALANGIKKNKFAQYYKGVPVYSSHLTNSEISGSYEQWWGIFLKGINDDIPSVTPGLTKQEALIKAKTVIGITKQNTRDEEIQLYIMQDKVSKKANLVYRISMVSEAPHNVSRPTLIMDANTGNIIDKWDGLTTKDAQGPGGNEKVGQYYYGRDFKPLQVNDACEMSTDNVETYNMNNLETDGVLFKFVCPENTYRLANGAYSPLNDAHYFGNIAFEMYKNWYKTSPIKTKLKLRVHYGQNYENAFWDGQQMTFGDGGDYLYPLISLDVVAHELSHGLTEQNSGLEYKGQSGGINEAFSDMAGEIAEYYMNSQVGKENDWLVGDAIIKGPLGTAMRYFATPTKDGHSIDNASQYNDSLDVHFTSGVFNKAYYTLAHQTDWNIRKAFEVFLLANQVYWKNDATYNSAACGVAKAATDLGYKKADVVSSFKVVGVNAECGSDPVPSDTEVEIANGQTVNNITLSANQERKFFITVPVLPRYPYNYKYLYVSMTDNTNTSKDVADLYVRYTSQLSYQQALFQDNNEYFYIQYPSSGKYHILIKAKNPGTVNLQAFYGN